MIHSLRVLLAASLTFAVPATLITSGLAQLDRETFCRDEALAYLSPADDQRLPFLRRGNWPFRVGVSTAIEAFAVPADS